MIRKSAKPKKPDKTLKKEPTLQNAKRLLKGRQKVLNGYGNKIFPIRKQTQGKEIKMLTPKQMLQTL